MSTYLTPTPVNGVSEWEDRKERGRGGGGREGGRVWSEGEGGVDLPCPPS